MAKRARKNTAPTATSSAAETERQALGRRRHRPGQHRHQHDDGNDEEVLEEEHAEAHLALRRAELAPRLVELEHHRRRRQADRQTDEECDAERLAGGRGDGGECRRGQRALRRAGDEERPAEVSQLADVELEPDGEQEENDPDLGEDLDPLDVLHPAEAGGTDG